MHFNGLKIRGALDDFRYQKCTNLFFEDKKRFECSFYPIEVHVIISCLVDIKKKHQIRDFLIFYRIKIL